MNENMPPDVVDALKYLRSGGLGEVIGFADLAHQQKQPKVQMDTDMAIALCVMAAQSLPPLPDPQNEA